MRLFYPTPFSIINCLTASVEIVIEGSSDSFSFINDGPNPSYFPQVTNYKTLDFSVFDNWWLLGFPFFLDKKTEAPLQVAFDTIDKLDVLMY